MSTPANETPRTDAQLAMVNDECRISGDDTFAEVSAWDFARQLERENASLSRELNEAREQIATLQGQTRWQCKCGGTDCEGQRENEVLKAALHSLQEWRHGLLSGYVKVIADNTEEIARLRAEVEDAQALYERERAERQKDVGMQEYRGNTVSYIYDKERAYGAHFDRMNKELADLRSELEVLRTTEQCQHCHKHLSPSLIEAGTCVFCAMEEAMAKLKTNYSRADAQPR